MSMALAISTSTYALDLPETSQDGKVTWYFLKTACTDERAGNVFTAVDGFVFNKPQASYDDYDTMARQLWCFEVDDEGWYTITNRYDGRKLGVAMGIHGEALALFDEPQAKFKLRELDSGTGFQSSMPAPGGGSIFLYPAATNASWDWVVWLVRESNSYNDESAVTFIKYEDSYAPQNSETVTWYNIMSAEDGGGTAMITDNTSVVDAQYRFTVSAKDPGDKSAQWRIVESQPGKSSIINRATGNSISTNLEADGRYNLPEADAKTVVPTTWNILPVSEGEYAFASTGTDNMKRLLSSQTIGSDAVELPSGSLANTAFAWKFSQAESETGIDNAAAASKGTFSVEDGRIVAPEGAKVRVITPEGIVIPRSARLSHGIYIVTVNGVTTKISVK